jgi:hypothetical protein
MTQDLVTCISFKAINSQGFQFNPNYQYMKIKQVQKKKKGKKTTTPLLHSKFKPLTQSMMLFSQTSSPVHAQTQIPLHSYASQLS